MSLAIRSSSGVELWSSATGSYNYTQNSSFARDETKNCRAMVFSPNGHLFAYTNTNGIQITETSDWKPKCLLDRPKTFHLKFSPRGTYVISWELFTVTKEKPDGGPNMFVFNAETGEELFSIIQKKQTDWEPRWSSDETLMALMIGGEAFFYELNSEKGFKSSVTKLGSGKNGILSVGPGNSPPFISFYVPGTQGAPSMCKIYKYPALQAQQAIACKSFFQADRVEMLWNKRGTGLLLLTSTEVDQSGASYYGKQALHFMAVKGESCSVPLSKEGPIHAVEWSPKGNEFVVVCGYMPAKATLFNLKCDPIFDFGEGTRNCVYFNDFGNIVLLAGFGNLRGYIEVWNMTKKNKVTTIQAPDTTLLEWCATGEIFMTATTAPRLRIGNGFKIWHYSGALLHETLWPQGQELVAIEWQKYAENTFTEPTIKDDVKIEGIKSSQPEASKQVYQPPNIRAIQEGKSEDSIPQPSALASGNSKRRLSNRRDSRGGDLSSRRESTKGDLSNRRDSNIGNLSSRRDSNRGDLSNRRDSNRGDLSNRRDSNKGDLSSRRDSKSTRKNSNKQNDLTNRRDSNIKTEVNNHDKEITDSENNSNSKTSDDQQNEDNPKNNENRRNSRYQNRRNSRKLSTTGDPEKDKRIRNLHKKLSDISKLKVKVSKGEHLEANQLKKIEGESSIIEELRTLKISSST